MTKSKKQTSMTHMEADPKGLMGAVQPEVDITPKDISPEPLNNFSKMPDEYIERNKIPVEEILPEPSNDLTPDELMTEKEFAELDAQQIEDLAPYNVKVGYPVVYEGIHAALVTKVLDDGRVNLIVFHDGHPVPDVRAEVPYQGEVNLYNTWKEIN
jgi:uncharacterized protein (DUF433 family)